MNDPKFITCVSLIMLNGIMFSELSEIHNGKHVSMSSRDSLQTLYHGMIEGIYSGITMNGQDKWLITPDDEDLKACRICLGGMQECFQPMQKHA